MRGYEPEGRYCTCGSAQGFEEEVEGEEHVLDVGDGVRAKHGQQRRGHEMWMETVWQAQIGAVTIM